MGRVGMRLDALEGKSPTPPPQAPAQPIPPLVPQVIDPMAAAPLTPSASILPRDLRIDPPREYYKPVSTSQTAEELEYKIGINGLLRGGIVVLLLALLSVAVMVAARGYITPGLQFAGELSLCAAFIGVGIWKRNEREEFGQLMVGLGSGGLYASFAGAHLVKHLIPGETLVALYCLLGFANLGYSYWRSSRSFLVIGMVGGLAAATFPMQRGQIFLDLGLHFLVLIPCAFIIIKNRWNWMATLMWFVSSVALLPAVTSENLQVYRIGAIYLSCAIALYAYGKTFTTSDFDPEASAQTIMLFLAGLLAIGVDFGHKGSLHAVVLAMIGVGVGYLLRENLTTRNSTWMGSLIVLTILTPMGFRLSEATFFYSAESILLIACSLRFPFIAAWILSLVTFGIGLSSYAIANNGAFLGVSKMAPLAESALLGLFSVAILLNIWRGLKDTGNIAGDGVLAIGSGLLVAGFVRLVNIWFLPAAPSLSFVEVSWLGASVASVVVSFAASKINRPGLWLIAAILVLMATADAIVRDITAPLQWLHAISLFLVAISIGIFAIFLAKSKDQNVRHASLLTSGVLWSACFLRLLLLPVATSAPGFGPNILFALGFCVLNLVWSALAWRRPSNELMLMAWVSFFFTCEQALSTGWNPLTPGMSEILLIVPLLTNICLYLKTPRQESGESVVASVFAIAGWVLGSILIHRELVSARINTSDVAAWTLSWVAVAVVLIIAGFWFERRHLRYWSLFIFGATLFKVMLFDLGALDPLIRALILLPLGAGMVGGGYWYIVWQKKKAPPVDTVGAAEDQS